MAKETDSLITLSPEQKAQIKDLQDKIPKARKDLARMKKMGLDVSALEEKLDWAEEVGKTLSEDFG